MIVFKTVSVAIVSAYLLMAFVHMSYVYAMGLKWARDNGGIPWPVYVFIAPTAVVMIPFYVMLNLSLGSLFFLEFPRSLRFTERCQRHMDDDTWRGSQARWWCRNFLDPFEEGGHC